MLSIRNLSKKFGTFSLEDIKLEVNTGEYFVLLGPSGAGKSLLFEVIAGIYKPDAGEIFLNGKEITNIPPEKREIGLVFQDNTLFPHFSVFENIAFPLKTKKLNRNQIREKVENLAVELSIGHLLERTLHSLSGGEIQRVTLARTLAGDPKCLLMDEPVSSLDVQLRGGILELLRKINQQGLTILHITHHLDEAVYQANRMAIIDKGKIIQIGKPEEIYSKPASEFVVNFLGYKNVYPFEKISEEKISILGRLEINFPQIKVSKGYVVIPDYAINILSSLKKNSNIFPCTIKSQRHFPEFIELVIDSGITLIKKIEGMSVNLITEEKLYVSIDAGSLIFHDFQ
ncbi:MAG: ATP-binding cassette domain-containing protein [Bacteroidales bacterium]|nr:ATP-binding cassette domain-containing protein [Bacteroidales bacterium]